MPLQKTDVRPSIGLALLPIVLTLGILGVQIFYFGDFTRISRWPLVSH